MGCTTVYKLISSFALNSGQIGGGGSSYNRKEKFVRKRGEGWGVMGL